MKLLDYAMRAAIRERDVKEVMRLLQQAGGISNPIKMASVRVYDRMPYAIEARLCIYDRGIIIRWSEALAAIGYFDRANTGAPFVREAVLDIWTRSTR